YTIVFRRRMERYRVAKLFTLLPHGIIIIVAVDAQYVEPASVPAAHAHPLRSRDRAPDQTAQSNCLEAERFAMFEFGNSLVRSMHRNYTDWRAAIPVRSPGFRCILIERITTSFAQFLVTDIWGKQLAVGWIKHRKVQTHLLHPTM